jgi:hypothetical protein
MSARLKIKAKLKATAQQQGRVMFEPVPKLWPNSTIVCIASGPSLTQADVDYVRGKCDAVIVVNNCYQLAPWADALYACDYRWWNEHRGVMAFKGLKYSLQRQSGKWKGVKVLQNTGPDGLERKPNGLKTGRNSGYQAMNLAFHLGAKRIVLLGYDMQYTHGKSHWHGDHPWGGKPPVQSFRGMFRGIVGPLAKEGVSVVNCTRETSLDCFPLMALEEALPAQVEAVA